MKTAPEQNREAIEFEGDILQELVQCVIESPTSDRLGSFTGFSATRYRLSDPRDT
jgi:hypothetical protein